RATLPVSVPSLPGCLRVGDRVLLVDGTRALRVTREGEQACEAVVEVGGAVRSHQGINVPGRPLGIGALTEKDRHDLAFACRQGVDYVGLSFVSTPEDVLGLKERLRARGSPARVVVKFELAAAVARMEEIGDASARVLSGETAAGRYPVLAVETMARLIRAAEELSDFGTGLGASAPDATDAVAQAAVELARDLDARAILALTENGGVARRLSAHRPSVP